MYLEEGLEVTVKYIDGKPVGVRFPGSCAADIAFALTPADTVYGVVESCPDGTQGQKKDAELTNGRRIKVPHFVKPGDRVSTRAHVARMR